MALCVATFWVLDFRPAKACFSLSIPSSIKMAYHQRQYARGTARGLAPSLSLRDVVAGSYQDQYEAARQFRTAPNWRMQLHMKI
jgi:hypothetical protein